jgi:hypothetical protein
MKINDLRRWGNSRGASVAALKHSRPVVARLKPQTADFHRLAPTGDWFFSLLLFLLNIVLKQM